MNRARLVGALVIVSFLSVLAPLERALAQPCITCRTERCADKPTLRGAAWCGQDKDPLAAPSRQRRPSKRQEPAAGPKPGAGKDQPVKADTGDAGGAEAPAPERPAEVAPLGAAPGGGAVQDAVPHIPAGPQSAPVGSLQIPPQQPASSGLVRTGAAPGRGMRTAGWVSLGAGLALGVTAAVLWPLDSRCFNSECKDLYNTNYFSAGLVAGGAALLTTSLVLLVMDRRRQRQARQP